MKTSILKGNAKDRPNYDVTWTIISLRLYRLTDYIGPTGQTMGQGDWWLIVRTDDGSLPPRPRQNMYFCKIKCNENVENLNVCLDDGPDDGSQRVVRSGVVHGDWSV